jgi:ubiquinone/menaquinone biosynthesis C-methylase UbiE
MSWRCRAEGAEERTILATRLAPRPYQGIDLCAKAVSFCQLQHARQGLKFSQGNAEALKCPDQSFDVVINLESSHGYPQMPKFLKEARRVLRPQGYLLLADFRGRDGVVVLQ